MGTLREIPIIYAPSQRLTTALAGRQCDFLVNYNPTSNRWSFDLTVDGELRLAGRRIVIGADLLPASLGLGQLRAVDWTGKGAEPGRTELPSGAVRLIHYDET